MLEVRLYHRLHGQLCRIVDTVNRTASEWLTRLPSKPLYIHPMNSVLDGYSDDRANYTLVDECDLIEHKPRLRPGPSTGNLSFAGNFFRDGKWMDIYLDINGVEFTPDGPIGDVRYRQVGKGVAPHGDKPCRACGNPSRYHSLTEDHSALVCPGNAGYYDPASDPPYAKAKGCALCGRVKTAEILRDSCKCSLRAMRSIGGDSWCRAWARTAFGFEGAALSYTISGHRCPPLPPDAAAAVDVILDAHKRRISIWERPGRSGISSWAKEAAARSRAKRRAEVDAFGCDGMGGDEYDPLPDPNFIAFTFPRKHGKSMAGWLTGNLAPSGWAYDRFINADAMRRGTALYQAVDDVWATGGPVAYIYSAGKSAGTELRGVWRMPYPVTGDVFSFQVYQGEANWGPLFENRISATRLRIAREGAD